MKTIKNIALAGCSLLLLTQCVCRMRCKICSINFGRLIRSLRTSRAPPSTRCKKQASSVSKLIRLRMKP